MPSGTSSVSSSRSSASNTSTPRSLRTCTNAACSILALRTQITSSKSSSSAFSGVRRRCSSPGRWTMTWRSLPTSESTLNGIMSHFRGRRRRGSPERCEHEVDREGDARRTGARSAGSGHSARATRAKRSPIVHPASASRPDRACARHHRRVVSEMAHKREDQQEENGAPDRRLSHGHGLVVRRLGPRDNRTRPNARVAHDRASPAP